MIKLERTPKPIELTAKHQKVQTEKYKLTGESVWNKDYIKNELLRFSYNKCCYCEAKNNEESKYIEVEHFHPKKVYQDEVLEWDNLLPTCKRCNIAKGSHDTKAEPIINPTLYDPKLHLKYWLFLIKPKDELGKITISVLDLNDERIIVKRYELVVAILKRLDSLNELTDNYTIKSSTFIRNKIINGTKSLMRQGLPESAYSATSATIILIQKEFKDLKSKLLSLSLWDEELLELEIKLQNVAFDFEQ